LSALATALAFARLQRSQWLDSDGLRRHQEAKLKRLLEHAWHTVPYYRHHLKRAGLRPADVRGLDDLAHLPVTRKCDLQAAAPDAALSAAFDPVRLVREHTSGSTGRPFTVAMERSFVALRDALFLRVLATAGYRMPQRLLLVTGDRHKRPRRFPPWRYASIEASPEALLQALEEFRPSVLYGCLTPLRRIALLAQARGRRTHRLQAVVSTAEGLDPTSRLLLEDAFGAPVYDAYGLTETGMIAWQCAAREEYHLAEDTAIVELVSEPDGTARMVVTNLELAAMPLIRFETGDLAVPGEHGTCSCGRHLRRLARLEGRTVDCIRLVSGELLSPYRFTLALERVEGIRRYQLIQHDLKRFSLRVEPGPDAGADLGAVAGRVIRGLLGAGADVEITLESALDPPPGRKFRVVESRLGQGAYPDPAALP
jgi:phenylacetate-CoA ligase